VASFRCMYHTDMKILVAASSVVHIGVCLAGLGFVGETGYEGAVWIIIGHGLRSSGLFYLVGQVYRETKRRSLILRKGLLNYAPILCI
jgi:NADH:ubiquinone oxidoreductase subunit 4 (subunit M)